MLPHKLSTAVLESACSREGAGLAEGLAILFKWSLVTSAVVLTLAVISGVVVGRRRGTVLRQVGRHVLWSTVGLVAVPVIASVLWMAWTPIEMARVAHVTAVTDAWMAPLQHARPGELDRALGAVLNAPDADSPARRIYLIAALPNLLEPAAEPLTETESSALRAAAALLRRENAERHFGSHPDNLEYVDAAVAWRIERPRLGAAFDACQGRRGCERHLLVIAGRWCEQDTARCAAAFDDSTLARIEDALHSQPMEAENVRFRRQRLRHARAEPAGGTTSAPPAPRGARPPLNVQ